ncbi:MAG: tryptophan--tRNA ligase [Chitinivibrionales bacterium]|nr:tryptophan--tRNA ligase [Chitinivibrionales bacterium]MBD3396790.1 tryptophan--tRNA ligase [Chitinivibrionales bacterium]
MRILSGIQPSGKLHIGNYLGMIRPMVRAQEEGELFCFIANMHSLTSIFDGKQMHQHITDALIDLLALGIDPDKAILWVQSDVPEVAELTWYLNCVTPVGLLQRCHSYKDKVARSIPASNGLFSYPVLMAADILMYSSNIVPVGQDQKQHVEVTRDIAIKFNETYGDILTLPEARIKEELAVIPGTDGQKMSKSYGNTIDIFAPEKQLRKTVMSIVTDSTPVEAPKDPDRNAVYLLYRLFAADEQALDLAKRFRAGGLGYGDAKKELFALLLEHFRDCRAKRERIAADPSYVDAIRKKGADKARAVGLPLLDKVRNAVGVR